MSDSSQHSAQDSAQGSAQGSARWRRHITDLIVGGEVSAEAVDDLADAGLSGYALHRLADRSRGKDGSPVDGSSKLQRGRVQAALRHAAVRHVVVDIVRAWREVGLESLLLKGFYLAEFVYPDPTWRPYSDVDIALRGNEADSPEALASLAAQVAADAGWRVFWRLGEAASVHGHHDDNYNGHELLQLVHGTTGIALDVHRRLVHSNVTSESASPKADAITSRVWAASRATTLEDVEVKVPSPLDSVLVGLIAGRSWSGDRYVLRPQDALDLRVLTEHGKFSRGGLLERARELGMIRTARLFLQRCDPDGGVVDLRAPGWLRIAAYDTLLMTERGHRSLQRTWNNVKGLSRRVTYMFLELPHLRARIRALESRKPNVPVEIRQPATRHLGRQEWRELQFAVRRAMQLLGRSPAAHPQLALVSLRDLARRRGHEVELRRDEDGTCLVYQGRKLLTNWLGVDVRDEAKLSAAVTSLSSSVVGRIATLGWEGVRLRLEALVLLYRIRDSLRSTPFKLVRQRALEGIRSRAPQPEPTPLAIGRAVESASRFVPGALCVARSLAGQVMLSKRAVGSTIHFGFLRSAEGKVEGHAWLVVGDEVVTGDVGLDNFTRTATFEA